MSEHWQKALKDIWGIDARLDRLDGEYDLNFMAKSAEGHFYVLKVMHAGCAPDLIDLQISALDHIRSAGRDVPVPAVAPTRSGQATATCKDETGTPRILWLQDRLLGETFASFSPRSADLVHALGEKIGMMNADLAGFSHPALVRDFKWNLMQADWITAHLDAITLPGRRRALAAIAADFAAVKPALAALPCVAIHNDLNDYNILVTGTLECAPDISGLIDFGDMCAAPRICELAIAAAYVVLDHDQPDTALAALAAGYHAAHPLTPAELDLLWPLLNMRLAVSIVNSTLMAREAPDDPYVTVSQGPAWRFLEGRTKAGAGLIRARLRAACGFPVSDAAQRVLAWLDSARGSFAPLIGRDLGDVPMGSLSVESSLWPQNPFDMPQIEAARVGQEFGPGPWLGYYGEPRLIYTAAAFRNGPWKASDRRTVHLAIDVFAASGAALHAPYAGRVHHVENRARHLDYGGVVILSHETPEGDDFYTLYGHLDPEVCERLASGQHIARGEAFCRLGDASQNGGWAPHVHFQLALSLDGIGTDWPGVADPDALYLWNSLCPNPAALLNLDDTKCAFEPVDKSGVLASRRAHFGANLKLSYKDPAMFLRGWKHHLFDEWGRPYLDAYNNVPHVGHAHPRLRAVAADQLARLNSNTRYLHPAQTGFAEKLLSKLPASLSVCYFVNSGTEANELALRLARAHSGGKAMVTPDHGYHGNTTGAIDISAYKFNAPGGVGQPDWVELVEVADDYRGTFRRDDPDRAKKFAGLVDGALGHIGAKGGQLAGFIAETFPSVGGQIIPPAGYLPAVYEKIRAAGGVCIADEVQTGLGRLGEYYFAFEHQGATPDIVVLGKPIGNGHPLGVVVTTPAIAASFARGPEYFSTFGGSTLSCLTGREVLQIIDDEALMANARVQGDTLLAGLRALQDAYSCIGDVRGMGLFVGVDLVRDRASRAPATALAAYVLNRMRARRILIGTEGPADNVLKIRPPLTIDAEGVAMILDVLETTLSESPCR